MALDRFLDEQDRLTTIALDVARELREELSGDWHLEAIGKKKKVVPPEEFYQDEYPNEYEAPEGYER